MPWKYVIALGANGPWVGKAKTRRKVDSRWVFADLEDALHRFNIYVYSDDAQRRYNLADLEFEEEVARTQTEETTAEAYMSFVPKR